MNVSTRVYRHLRMSRVSRQILHRAALRDLYFARLKTRALGLTTSLGLRFRDVRPANRNDGLSESRGREMPSQLKHPNLGLIDHEHEIRNSVPKPQLGICRCARATYGAI